MYVADNDHGRAHGQPLYMYMYIDMEAVFLQLAVCKAALFSLVHGTHDMTEIM